MASAGVSTFHPTRRAVQPSLQWREGRGAKVEKQAADRVQQWSGKAAFRVKDSQYIYIYVINIVNIPNNHLGIIWV